jgi:hypothetical protein
VTLPALAFGLVLSTLYGALFHLWRDGGFGRLVLYILLSWIGFWAGHLLGGLLGLGLGVLGPLNLGMATLGSLAALFVGHWLSLVDASQGKSRGNRSNRV